MSPRSVLRVSHTVDVGCACQVLPRMVGTGIPQLVARMARNTIAGCEGSPKLRNEARAIEPEPLATTRASAK